jgi:hypothetical protein
MLLPLDGQVETGTNEPATAMPDESLRHPA